MSRPSSEQLRAERAAALAAQLRAGEPVQNKQLDALYPPAIRALSASYWTPLPVALRAVQMLVRAPGDRVLDIGSGVGKLCGVGAVVTRGVFHGVEQRAELVRIAREFVHLLGTVRASFTHGSFEQMTARDYDAFYLFNPFEENEDRSLAASDRQEFPGDDWFHDDVRRAQEFLSEAKTGARVVTYNGISGPLPECYQRVERVSMRCELELWVKR